MTNKQAPEFQHLQSPCGCHEGHASHDPDCGGIILERNNFYMGKFMSLREFKGEQEYFISRHRLHNRLLHGWGIVCGLEVEYHPDRLAGRKDSECAKRWVRVRPGIAIDCCGRELILAQDSYYQLPLPPPRSQDPDQPPRREQYILGLRYQEELIEYMQVLYAEDICEGKREQANRLRESAHLAWVQRGRLPENCWAAGRPDLSQLEETLLFRLREAEGSCSAEQLRDYASHTKGNTLTLNEVKDALRQLVHLRLARKADGDRYEAVPVKLCRDDCAEGSASRAGSCLEPACPCGFDGLVPLAMIEFDPASPEWNPGPPETGFTIDTLGRKDLPPSPDQLTHIIGYNWPHGGRLSLTEIAMPKTEGGLGGRLEIYFDRKLMPDHPAPSTEQDEDLPPFRAIPAGVNAFTFMVEFHNWNPARHTEESWYRFTMLHDRAGTLPHAEQVNDQCMAVFPLPADLLEGEENLGDAWLHIILKCDFILDCHGLPVDGEHRRGRWPTGDGLPGGTFESWVYVEDDLPRKPKKERERR